LNWAKSSDYFITRSLDSDVILPITLDSKPNWCSAKYTTLTYRQAATGDKCIYTTWEGASFTGILIKDSSYSDSSEADFKAAMSGVHLVFELATPQYVTFTDPSDAIYQVDKNGTEQLLPVNDSNPVTLGLNSQISYGK